MQQPFVITCFWKHQLWSINLVIKHGPMCVQYKHSKLSTLAKFIMSTLNLFTNSHWYRLKTTKKIQHCPKKGINITKKKSDAQAAGANLLMGYPLFKIYNNYKDFFFSQRDLPFLEPFPSCIFVIVTAVKK